MTDPDRARADAALFLNDALQAAADAMAERPDPRGEGRAYLAVFVLLASAALFPQAKQGIDCTCITPEQSVS